MVSENRDAKWKQAHVFFSHFRNAKESQRITSLVGTTKARWPEAADWLPLLWATKAPSLLITAVYWSFKPFSQSYQLVCCWGKELVHLKALSHLMLLSIILATKKTLTPISYVTEGNPTILSLQRPNDWLAWISAYPHSLLTAIWRLNYVSQPYAKERP